MKKKVTNEIGGMMILKQFYPRESMCEIASQIFRKKYRGCGLAEPFFRYGIEILQAKSYSAAYCLPVMFHDITQRLLYRQGLRATGFILNVFDMKGSRHSYDNGKNSKHSQGIQIMALGKKDAGTLYLPVEHRKFCQKIYENLGVAYRMEEGYDSGQPVRREEGYDSGQSVRREEGYDSGQSVRREEGYDSGQSANRKIEFDSGMPEHTALSYRNDEYQKSLEIQIYKVGADLQEQMGRIHSRYPLCGSRTAGVFLNCNDRNSIRAYEMLKGMGYFFTGLKPLCSDREYLVLHHPGQVRIAFEDYVVNEEFAGLLNYIRKCYEEQYGENQEGGGFYGKEEHQP